MTFMKHEKILSLLLGLVVGVFIVGAPVVHAQLGLEETAGRAGLYKKGGSNDTLIETVGKVVDAGLSIISIVFFTFILYAGFRWMVARGNEADIDYAQETITNSIIGIIVVLAAYAISSFLFNALTTGDVISGEDPGSGCDVYKEIDSSFACTTQSNCEASVATLVRDAYNKKKVGSYNTAGGVLDKFIGGVCAEPAQVCCIPKGT